MGGKFKSLDGVLVLGIAADRVIAADRDVLAIVPEFHGQGDPRVLIVASHHFGICTHFPGGLAFLLLNSIFLGPN